jgi:hypothetical protein
VLFPSVLSPARLTNLAKGKATSARRLPPVLCFPFRTGAAVKLVGQPAVPAPQITQESSRPVLRPLESSLHQQGDVEEEHCERRGCQRWEPARHVPLSLLPAANRRRACPRRRQVRGGGRWLLSSVTSSRSGATSLRSLRLQRTSIDHVEPTAAQVRCAYRRSPDCIQALVCPRSASAPGAGGGRVIWLTRRLLQSSGGELTFVCRARAREYQIVRTAASDTDPGGQSRD